MSTPGWSAGTISSDSPLCRCASGSVRHSTYSQSAYMPNDIQVFWPSSTHSSPSRRARVRSDARSDPASGSLKPWPQNSRPAVIRGRNRRFCSSCRTSAGWARTGPTRDTPARYGACARASSSFRTTSWYVGAPRPPYSAGQVRPSQPAAASCSSHRTRTSQASASSALPRPRCSANSPTRCSSSQARTSWRKASSSSGTGRIVMSSPLPIRGPPRAARGAATGSRTAAPRPWPA